MTNCADTIALRQAKANLDKLVERLAKEAEEYKKMQEMLPYILEAERLLKLKKQVQK